MVGNPMLFQLREILDQHDRCRVECDGFIRIAAYVLEQAGIPFKVYTGYAYVRNADDTDDDLVNPHWWIEVQDEDDLTLTVDYRLRMWCGDHAPHGVFYANDEYGIQYGDLPDSSLKVEVPDFKTSKQIFEILTSL